MYLAGPALVAAGFADFPVIAFHFARASTVPKDIVPVAYCDGCEREQALWSSAGGSIDSVLPFSFR